jgi:hypothetical protein
VAGRLAGAPTARGLGLPTTVAAVLVAGVASLLVRLLLAEPAAGRRPVPRPAPVLSARLVGGRS